MSNNYLYRAKKLKRDEVYTSMNDINNELYRYTNHFKDKVILCNCNDLNSNFMKYFLSKLDGGLIKKLIVTSHWEELNNSYCATLDKDFCEYYDIYNRNNTYEDWDFNCIMRNALASSIIDFEGKYFHKMNGNGDFREPEMIELLKEADIVVTNPPFSLFREYITQLMEYDKKFLIIGNVNAITYKEFFPLLMNNKVKMGYNTPKEFIINDGKSDVIGLCRWFTNLSITKRHEDIILYKKYTPEEYPKYDNYDAINVNKTADIPCDYYGAMGVPITFMDKYNPEQFEIIGLGTSRDNFTPNKCYINPKRHKKDKVINGEAINSVLTIECEEQPKNTVYYTSDNSKYLITPYARIIIKRKGGDA